MINKKWFLSVVPAVMVMAAFMFTSTVCKKTDEVKIDTTKKVVKSPLFVKQGEVYFQDKGRNLIRQIDVEIADSDQKRHLGLMFRENMDTNQGMLFIFPKEEEQAFYMKNTIMPLDIIFITSQHQIVKIYKHTTPYSEKDLPSNKPILYVVEVNAGFSDRFGVKEGQYIDFRRF